MNLKTILSLTVLISLLSCGNRNEKNNDTLNTTDTKNEELNSTETEAAKNGKELLGNVTKPDSIQFARQNFEGIGTIEFPTGNDWVKEGNELYNEKWDMTIVVQSHAGEILGREKLYLDDYSDVNNRDATNWKRGTEELGMIQGLSAARTEGSFNNGKAYVVRDYIFFDKNKVAVVQTRTLEKNTMQLGQVADFIASSFKR
jgi:hypothetical protein